MHIYICLYTTVCTRLNKHFIEGTFRLKLRFFSWKNCFNSQQKQVTPGEKGPSGDPTWCLGVFLCRIQRGFMWAPVSHKASKINQRYCNNGWIIGLSLFLRRNVSVYMLYQILSIPRTQMTTIFEGQHHQNMTFSKKTWVIWVPGTYRNVPSRKNRDQFANWMHSPGCFTLARETRYVYQSQSFLEKFSLSLSLRSTKIRKWCWNERALKNHYLVSFVFEWLTHTCWEWLGFYRAVLFHTSSWGTTGWFEIRMVSQVEVQQGVSISIVYSRENMQP